MPTTGIPSLDELLGGLVPGDNVVWVTERSAAYDSIEQAFFRTGDVAIVATTKPELELAPGTRVVDATPGSPFATATALADELDRQMPTMPLLAVDGLAVLARRWGIDETVRFFARMCPSMLQAGVITYWRVPPSFGPTAIESMRQVTQCLIELRPDQLLVLKAESRSEDVQGSAHHHRIDDGEFVLTGRSSAGRLARGLSSVRKDLGLTQAQLAAAGGITASAVSQAETGARGLSLDTLLTLSDRLGIGLDRLVSGTAATGYRLSRHDRSLRAGPTVSLADDPAVGLRAFLVNLSGDGAPPIEHRGIELVAVLRGLVQVSVGGDRPVLRAGDSLLATAAPITGWRNLRPDPAAFYWVLRD